MSHTERPIYQQSAVIPFKKEMDEIEVLLITNRRRKRWVIPKGLIEEDLSAIESAEQEAFEEAGIRGTVYPKSIGLYTYDKWGGICEVAVFLMEVEDELDEWPESFRGRKWLTPSEATTQVRERDLQAMLANLPRLIGQLA